MPTVKLRDASARAQWKRFRTVAARLGVDVDEAEGQAAITAAVRPDLDDAEVLLLVLAQIAGDR